MTFNLKQNDNPYIWDLLLKSEFLSKMRVAFSLLWSHPPPRSCPCSKVATFPYKTSLVQKETGWQDLSCMVAFKEQMLVIPRPGLPCCPQETPKALILLVPSRLALGLEVAPWLNYLHQLFSPGRTLLGCSGSEDAQCMQWSPAQKGKWRSLGLALPDR